MTPGGGSCCRCWRTRSSNSASFNPPPRSWTTPFDWGGTSGDHRLEWRARLEQCWLGMLTGTSIRRQPRDRRTGRPSAGSSRRRIEPWREPGISSRSRVSRSGRRQLPRRHGNARWRTPYAARTCVNNQNAVLAPHRRRPGSPAGRRRSTTLRGRTRLTSRQSEGEGIRADRARGARGNARSSYRGTRGNGEWAVAAA